MKHRFPVSSAIAFAAIASAVAFAAEEPAKPATVSVRKLADSLHAVIAADQQAYIEQVIGRAPTPLGASSDGPEPQTKAASGVAALPTHAALLKIAAQKIQTGGAEFSYTLRSLKPIDVNNGPQTQAEQDGLEHVAKLPNEPYYANEQLGGRSYFTAVYAQRASSASCIECHNQNPKSPRHDLKKGDVIGALVVRVPLEF